MKSNTYQYLSKYKYKLVDVKALREKIIDLNNSIYIACSTSIITFEKDRNIENINPDNLLNSKISNLIDLKEEYTIKVKEIEDLCIEIRNYIKDNASNELTRTILERYFCDLWSFGKIAINTSYSFPHVKKMFYDEIKILDSKHVNTK